MAASSYALEKAKRYMRVETDEDDGIIASLCEAAALYLKNAGIEPPDEDAALYELALWSLTLHYYDHRDAVGSEAPFPTGLRPIITQLKLTAGSGNAETEA